MKKKQLTLIALSIILLIVILIFIFFKLIYSNIKNPEFDDTTPNSTSFTYNLIKEVNKNKIDNYLISPYSISNVLSIIKDGSNNETKEELESILGNFKTIDISVKNKISNSNLLLINKNYKNTIDKNYIKQIEKTYDSEIKYSNITVDEINSWVDKNTNHMIKKLVDDINQNTIIEILNAVSIDVEWKKSFNCKSIHNAKFNTTDGNTVDTVMMSSSDANYIESDTAKGIIKEYKTYKTDNHKKINLEYIAIMPNDSIDEYINNFNIEEFRKLLNSKENYLDSKVSLTIPRYEYNYDFNDIKDVLTNLGIKSIFSSDADLSLINSNNEKGLYVSDMVHKAYISFNENGTKASASTGAGIEKTALQDVPIDIEFDRPFIYIIKEEKNEDILFFGVVYTPEISENVTDYCN